MKVAVIGAGYVGSVTGAAFAASGHHVTVIDSDKRKVDRINSGRSPIYEPGLDALIDAMVRRRLLSASDRYDSIRDADVAFIAVGTPSRPDGTADLAYVRSAADAIGDAINRDRFTVIVDKSTVPVGTAALVASRIEERSGLKHGEMFAVASNPEFLREGYALEDVFYPDRIVIGTGNAKARRMLRKLYAPLLGRRTYGALADVVPQPSRPLAEPVYFETDEKSAEMIKYVSNAFLAVKISYINEVAKLCEALGTDVNDVAAGVGLDSRIGAKFLQVSSGWSGSCFPKDTAELLSASRKYGNELTIVQAAVDSNRSMHDYCVEKVRRRLKTLIGKRIGVLGLTFKPNTDDARQTQASAIISGLLDLGASVSAHDPQGMAMFQTLNPDLEVRYCSSGEETAEGADGVLLLTHWDEYARLDWVAMRRRMRTPYVLDTRNFLRKAPWKKRGIEYEGIGIGAVR
ncbi:UDP-glucose dehydrogenase family protein [Paenibacillus ginsengarvi]|uniref:UDP-glucose 6-dehydrogenase n=1 Tax=Paenibacillus ginsengarvi TaxID=400777 RepID=A0A3B0CJE7_9BACL|nr:UDP-glucose/GDP-mannose dehydrogenase family protein [Paenibacillus ginsengarvi]RKN85322.1 UDP-glucose/GDP-mannose dehydrogenase family protein [Paenibacillus ginsengarvi]